MKMDIGTPVELMKYEYTEFGSARQAYLTFLNESPHLVTALSGRFLLLDASGGIVENRRVAFGQLHADAGQTFACHLTLEESAAHATATMVVEDVVFDGAEPWSLHPLRLKEYEDPPLAEGPDRNALIAIAGHDALCFPQRQENTWLCVCGRYNRLRWSACRRCQRERDKVLTDYTQEKVLAAHAARIEKVRKAPPYVLVDGAKRKNGQRMPSPQKKASVPPRQILLAVLGCMVIIALVWGIIALTKRAPEEQDNGQAPVNAAVTVAPDYLLPIRE